MTQISNSDIGKRVTIRLKDGAGYRDIVGHLKSTTSLLNRHGQLIDFDPAEIHIWREIVVVPRTATSGAPLSIRIYELEEAMAKTWRAKEEEIIDGWLFRADIGITKRANSALVLNQDSKFNDHIDELIDWYRKRNLNPAITLIPKLHSELDIALAGRGFEITHDCFTMVKNRADSIVDFEYQVTDNPSHEWLASQGDEKIGEIFTRSEAKYLSILLEGAIVAAGRIGFADGWAVLSRIWVKPDQRGKGFGRKILAALENESGGHKLALQVESKNEISINLYETMGYTTHHIYRIREQRPQIDLIQDLCC